MRKIEKMQITKLRFISKHWEDAGETIEGSVEFSFINPIIIKFTNPGKSIDGNLGKK